MRGGGGGVLLILRTMHHVRSAIVPIGLCNDFQFSQFVAERGLAPHQNHLGFSTVGHNSSKNGVLHQKQGAACKKVQYSL